MTFWDYCNKNGGIVFLVAVLGFLSLCHLIDTVWGPKQEQENEDDEG